MKTVHSTSLSFPFLLPFSQAKLSLELIRLKSYVQRFHTLFPLPPLIPPSLSSPLTPSTPRIPSILIPGNHDLGLHLPSSSIALATRKKFINSWNGGVGGGGGGVNGVKVLGGWEVVWVDSMALIEAGVEGDSARTFVSYISDSESIPLYLSLSFSFFLAFSLTLLLLKKKKNPKSNLPSLESS